MNFFEIMFARSLSGGSGGGGGGSAPVYQEGFHNTGAKWIDGREICYFAVDAGDNPITTENNSITINLPDELSIYDVVGGAFCGEKSGSQFSTGYNGKSVYKDISGNLSVSNLEAGDNIYSAIIFFTVEQI